MRAEAQQAITSQMGETVTVLLQELEEERAEGIRKDSETGEYLCERIFSLAIQSILL